MNIKTAGQIQTIDVTLGGCVTIDDLERDEDFTEGFRVSYYIGERGGVVVTQVEKDETRPGKPEIWARDHLPRFAVRLIERMIEKEVRQRMAA